MNALFYNFPSVITFLLVCCIVFVNGATDAVNAVASCVCSKSMGVRGAVLLSSVFNFLGVLIMGRYFNGVMHTVSQTVNVENGAESVLIPCILSVIMWAVGAWIFGIPTSESHALTASLIGCGFAYGGLGGVNFLQVSKSLYGLIFSLVVGCAVGFLITLALGKFSQKKYENACKGAQIFGCACMSFAHGGQDGLKLAGLFLLMNNKESLPLWMLGTVSLLMLFGTALGGKKIIKTVCTDMVSLNAYQGFCADISGALCLFLASVTSIPVSTTQVKASAMIGACISDDGGEVNKGVIKNMILTWLVTFPACAVLAFFLTKLFMQ